jgi:hypothetical protein
LISLSFQQKSRYPGHQGMPKRLGSFIVKNKLNIILVLTFGLVAHGTDQKPKSIAGTYVGVVDDDQAKVVIKADGSIIIRPNVDAADLVLRGTWKRKGNLVTASLADNDGAKGTIHLRVDGGDLVMVKVIEPDGDVKQFGRPQFEKKNALAKKGPAGVYVGIYDDEQLQVEVKPGGAFVVKAAADPNGEPIYSGDWKATGFGLSARILTDDGQQATVEMVTTAKGLAIRKVIDPDGEEQVFAEARLKRVKKDGKASPAEAKKLAGVWLGVIEEEEARVVVKADGTLTVTPDVNDPDQVMRGTWKLAKGEVIAQLRGDEGRVTVHLAVDGADLVLKKFVNSNGEEETFEPPRLRRKETFDNQKFAGVYEGEVDESAVKLSLELNGVLLAEVNNCGELETHTFKWVGKGNHVSAITDDGLKITFRADGKDLLLIRIESPDGEVEAHEPRFRKQKDK